MTDVLTPAQRSRCMAAIRGRDTKPEMVVRRLVHSLGYRYRLHVRRLPGTPDLVFPGRRKVIFVHGCFWHRHDCPYGRPVPKTRAKFWRDKLAGNVARDVRHRQGLQDLGWDVLTVWECNVRKGDIDRLAREISAFLEGERGEAAGVASRRG